MLPPATSATPLTMPLTEGLFVVCIYCTRIFEPNVASTHRIDQTHPKETKLTEVPKMRMTLIALHGFPDLRRRQILGPPL